LKYLFACLFIAGATSFASDGGKKIYDPGADARAQLSEATVRASAKNQHVLIIVGGNWCSWCMKLDRLLKTDPNLSAYVAENFQLVHVNYSPENQNKEVLQDLQFPQRFGFPVLLVLDGKGQRLHTQNSGYLEEGDGHSSDKVMAFLKKWSAAALKAETYAEESK